MKNKNLTKIDIAKNLSNKTGFSTNLSKKKINDLLNAFIKVIQSSRLNLKNIGTFKLLEKKERIGRNPITKKEYIIKARKSLSFIASKKLMNILNKN